MKNRKIKGQFIPHRLDMLQSPAWRALNHSAKRILECLEVEYMRKGGNKNGELICTYSDFAKAGIRRNAIRPGIHLACRCGFSEITQRGRFTRGGNVPACYRLTYLPTAVCDPTDEWREFKPQRANHNGGSRNLQQGRKRHQIPGIETDTGPGAKTPVSKPIPDR
jgi:hypothetical protein